MQFIQNGQPIYLQIADMLCEKILLDEWEVGKRIPSVRELAVQLEVNPNTVARTYDYLKQLQIIQDQRGIGYFVCEDAKNQAQAWCKKQFFEMELPPVFRKAFMLGISENEFLTHYQDFINQRNNK